MRTDTTSPEADESDSTIHIAVGNPRASAVTPASSAPIAYPKSRQSR